jgi:hypothetical protein
MHHHRSIASWLLVPSFFASLAGCAADASSEKLGTTGTTEEALLADNAVSLGASDVAGAQVEGDAIVFTAPTDAVLGLKPGATITAAGEETAFLRTVTAVEKLDATGAVRVHTQAAPLTALVKRLAVHRHLALPVLAADFSGKPLLGDAHANVACSSCSVSYAPSLDLDLAVAGGKVNGFRAAFDGDLVGRVAIAATADGTVPLEKEIEVAHLTTRLVQMIGAVPIWEDVTVSVMLGVKGTAGPIASLETGVTATKRTSGGVAYDGAQWSTFGDGEVTFEAEPLTLQVDVGADLEAYVKPRVDVKLYSVAGPYLAADAHVDLHAQICPPPAAWTATAGFGIDVGASLGFLDLVNVSVDEPLYRKDFPLASGALPESPVACGPTTL